MFSRKSLFVAGIVAGLIGIGSAANATSITYTLDNGGGAFPTPGNYGTVTLDDSSGTYTLVTVTLTSGYHFVTTGNATSHSLFAFNCVGACGAVSDYSAPNSPGATWTSSTSTGASPFGTFDMGIFCNNCANGAPGEVNPPLSFRVAGMTVADFASLSTGGNPDAYFSADLIGPDGVTTGQVGATCSADDNCTPSVPEPTTLALLGLGLLGIGAARRRHA